MFLAIYIGHAGIAGCDEVEETAAHQQRHADRRSRSDMQGEVSATFYPGSGQTSAGLGKGQHSPGIVVGVARLFGEQESAQLFFFA